MREKRNFDNLLKEHIEVPMCDSVGRFFNPDLTRALDQYIRVPI